MQSGAAARNIDSAGPQYAVSRDLARFDPRSRVREAAREMPAHQRAVSAPRAKTAARVYMRLSPFAVASFLAAAGLLLLIVFSCMQVSVLNLETNKLNKELTQLKNEEKQLIKQMDKALDLEGIENYAQYELGMVKPDRGHIVYVDLSGEDHGVVYETESFGDALKGAVSGAWAWICGFFD